MLLAPLLAFAFTVSEPRIPAGGPGGNTHNSVIMIQGEPSTTRLHVSLDAPQATPLLSTGFPYTEGTRLWDIEADAAQIELHYLFPIRGTYTLNVDETHGNGMHSSFKKSIDVPEDPRTLCALAAFIAALFGAGAIAGSLLVSGVALRTATLLCVALLATSIPAYAFDAATAPGILWPVTARITGGDPSVFVVEVANVEENKQLFRATLPSRDGRLRLRFQFYDGAPHVLAMLALRDRMLMQTWRKNIQVNALEPPLGRRLWILFEMLSIFAAGYAAGAFARYHKTLKGS